MFDFFDAIFFFIKVLLWIFVPLFAFAFLKHAINFHKSLKSSASNTSQTFKSFNDLQSFKEQFRQKLNASNFTLEVKKDYINATELKILNLLHEILNDSVSISFNVSLFHLFYTPVYKAQKKLTNRHFDFLIIDKSTGKPLLALEYDGAHHKDQAQIKRDTFKNLVCKIASLPLLRINYTDPFSSPRLKKRLEEHLDPKYFLKAPSFVSVDSLLCTKCLKPLQKRVSEKGNTRGLTFYACENFSECKTVLRLREV